MLTQLDNTDCESNYILKFGQGQNVFTEHEIILLFSTCIVSGGCNSLFALLTLCEQFFRRLSRGC